MTSSNDRPPARSAAAQERRKPRYTSALKVIVFGRGLETFEPERAANISSGGLFICTNYESKIGETLHVRIVISNIDSYFEVKTRVAWVADGSTGHPVGLGLEFVELSPQQASVIGKILRNYINIKE